MKPRSLADIFKLAPLACACLLVAGAHVSARAQGEAQSPSESFTAEVADGVALYRQGDYEGAVKAFKKAASKKRDDPDAWHFLGLSYAKLGRQKDALEAVEKAVHFGLDQLISKPAPRGEDYQKLSAEERAARRLKQVASLRRAADIVEDYLSLEPQGAAFWRAQLASLRFHAEQLAKPADQASVFSAADVDKKAQITDRPIPEPTERAKSLAITGTITIRFVLAADGTVQHLLVLDFLPEGLTDKAIEATRAIKFIPAMKGGRQVSQFAAVVYSFNVF